MAGELGSRDGPFHPRDYRFYAQTGSNSHFMRRQNYPSNRLCSPIRPPLLLARDATSRAWDNPVVPLPPRRQLAAA